MFLGNVAMFHVWPSLTLLCKPLQVFHALSVVFLGVVLGQNDKSWLTTNVTWVDMNGAGTVQSTGFPDSCCSALNFTIAYNANSSRRPGYIHLSFDDLDIPQRSKLRIYRGGASSGLLFRDQPDFRRGQWYRPFLSTAEGEGNIQIVFTPPPEIAATFVGFKAVYTATGGPEWYNEYDSEPCPTVSSAMVGGKIVVKPLPAGRFKDKWLDCIWQLKKPDGPLDEISKYMVYVNITDLDAKELVIRDGLSSDSPLLWNGENMESLEQTGRGFISTSGLYLRLRSPATDSRLKLQFHFGFYKTVSEDETCEFHDIKGHRCEGTDWCIPWQHACNNVTNCLLGDDEDPLLCRPPPTTTTTTTAATSTTTRTTTTTTSSPCPLLQILCDDGRCISSYDDCDEPCGFMEKLCDDGRCIKTYDKCDNPCTAWETRCNDGTCADYFDRCPNTCASYEKPCGDDCVYESERCPGDPCQYSEQTMCDGGKTCIYEFYMCDGSPDCTDGSDEEDCSIFGALTRYEFVPIVVVSAGLLICSLVCYKVCRRGRSSRAASSGPGEESGPISGRSILAVGVVTTLAIVFVLACVLACYFKRAKSSSRRARAPARDVGVTVKLPYAYSGMVTGIAIAVAVFVLCCTCILVCCCKFRRAHARGPEAGPGSSILHNIYFLLLAPLLALMCFIFCYKWCKRQNRRETAGSAMTGISRTGYGQSNYSGTHVHPVAVAGATPNTTPTPTPYVPTRIDYDPVPQADPAASAPPPSYNEVTTTDRYHIPTAPPPDAPDDIGIPPPPSYDAVVNYEPT